MKSLASGVGLHVDAEHDWVVALHCSHQRVDGMLNKNLITVVAKKRKCYFTPPASNPVAVAGWFRDFCPNHFEKEIKEKPLLPTLWGNRMVLLS